MGCVVTARGEKRGGYRNCGRNREGLLIKKGKIIKKVKEDQLLSVLREELLNWNE